MHVRASDAALRSAVGPQHGETLLDDIEYRFLLRGRGPQPLAVDGREIGHGLPRRAIPLTELSAVLMHPSCSYAARDAVWRLLARRARSGVHRRPTRKG